MKTGKSKQIHQISLRLTEAEYTEVNDWRQQLGLSNKALLLHSLRLAAEHGLLELEQDSAKMAAPSMQLPPEQEAQLAAAQQRGELFAFADKQDYLLLAVELDQTALPDWQPLRLTPLKDYPTAEAALWDYCQHGAGHAELAQIVLLHRASADTLGLVPAPNPWYYPAHILLELYPRIMNSFGDHDYYEGLLQRYYLEED